MGLSDDDVSHAYYTTMLRFVGCTAPMPEYAASMGVADTDMRPRGDMTDMTNPREAFSLLFSLGGALPAWRRPAVWGRRNGPAVGRPHRRRPRRLRGRSPHGAAIPVARKRRDGALPDL